MANLPFGQVEIYGRRPAEAFERANGLKGLSRLYKLPVEHAAWSSADMDRWLHARFNETTASSAMLASNLKVFNALADDIVRLNPELQAVRRKPDDIRYEYAFLAGCSAGYNPHDIDYYLRYHQRTASGATHRSQMAYLKRMDELMRRQAEIGRVLEEMNGTYTQPAAGCVFSPRTLALIERQIGIGLPLARPRRLPIPRND